MIVRERPTPGRISVVIAGRGRPERVRASAESAAGQSRGDLEIVCVDTSAGGDLREEMEASGAGAAYLPMPGASRAAALNAGIAATNGQFVAFLHPEGLWSPDKVDRQLAFMEAHNDIGLVFSRARIEGASGEGIVPAPGGAWQRLFDAGVGVDDPAAFYAVMLLGEIVPLSSVLMKRLVLPTEGPFRQSRHPFEEFDFTLRISELTRFAFVDDVLVSIPAAAAPAPAADAEAAMTALEMFRDNVSRNPWLEARDRKAIRKRERDLLRDSGRLLVQAGRGAEARPYLAEALKRNLFDLRLGAAYLSSLAGSRRPPAESS